MPKLQKKTLCGPYCMLFGSTAGLTGGLSISSATVSLTVEVVTYELWSMNVQHVTWSWYRDKHISCVQVHP